MSFDTLAPHYRWMEAALAGTKLQRARTAWLDHLAGCEQILIAGVGHGPFLPACRSRFPNAIILCVDASAGMLAQARRRLGANTRNLEFVHAALPDWQPEAARFDAIVTHFFLDCFAPHELELVIGTLARAARPTARWLVSDFSIPARGWHRQRARVIHAAMYAFFRPATRIHARRITTPDPLLRAAGFTLRSRKTFDCGLIQADAWQRNPR